MFWEYLIQLLNSVNIVKPTLEMQASYGKIHINSCLIEYDKDDHIQMRRYSIAGSYICFRENFKKRPLIQYTMFQIVIWFGSQLPVLAVKHNLSMYTSYNLTPKLYEVI
jgi:hypothetical protein